MCSLEKEEEGSGKERAGIAPPPQWGVVIAQTFFPHFSILVDFGCLRSMCTSQATGTRIRTAVNCVGSALLTTEKLGQP